MEAKNRKLVLQQIDSKIKPFSGLENIPGPGNGWINGIRTALNMTLEQLAKKMGITKQSLQDFEKREKQGTITLNTIRQVATALDMKLIYAIVPKEGSLEEKVENRVWEKAKEIVDRTSNTMELEDQANEPGRIMRAYEEKKNELRQEIPKFLWD
jgi:predicted DNA-binding mobile mystery protein A